MQVNPTDKLQNNITIYKSQLQNCDLMNLDYGYGAFAV